MEKIVPNSRALDTVMILAEKASRVRCADAIITPHVLFAIAVEFPGYWKRIGIEPDLAIKHGNNFSYRAQPPEIISPSLRTTIIGNQAQELARRERADIVTIGHWVTAYFIDDELRCGPYRDTPFDPVAINNTIAEMKPFHDEPKTGTDELLRETLGEPYATRIS